LILGDLRGAEAPLFHGTACVLDLHMLCDSAEVLANSKEGLPQALKRVSLATAYGTTERRALPDLVVPALFPVPPFPFWEWIYFFLEFSCLSVLFGVE